MCTTNESVTKFPRMIRIEQGDALAAPLMECSQSGEFLCILLPNGDRLWVNPERSLVRLVKWLGDAEFVGMLEGAAGDFVSRRGQVLDHDQTPRALAAEAIATEQFCGLLAQAAEDFRTARGQVLDHAERPARNSAPVDPRGAITR